MLFIKELELSERCVAGKRYFQHTKLGDIIDAYPYKSGLTDAEQAEQRNAREAFLDFLWGILVRLALPTDMLHVSKHGHSLWFRVQTHCRKSLQQSCMLTMYGGTWMLWRSSNKAEQRNARQAFLDFLWGILVGLAPLTDMLHGSEHTWSTNA